MIKFFLILTIYSGGTPVSIIEYGPFRTQEQCLAAARHHPSTTPICTPIAQV